VAQALARARRHGRTAAAEALAMLRALIEAASITAGGRPSEASRLFGPISKLLDGFAEELAHGTGGRSSEFLASIAAAIDAEIAHWEERARDDTEARTVLRAFLGLREVLWEIGVKPSATPSSPPATASDRRPDRPDSHRGASPKRGERPDARKSRPGPRVQRVPVQG